MVAGIIQSAEETIPKSTGSRRKKNVLWWDENCRKAVKSRNKAFRQLKKHHSIETLIQYKKPHDAVVRTTIRTAKRDY